MGSFFVAFRICKTIPLRCVREVILTFSFSTKGENTDFREVDPENPNAGEALLEPVDDIFPKEPPCSLQQMTYQYLGVSKNRGTPKWMVYIGKPY